MVDCHGKVEPRIESWPTPALIPVHGNWLGNHTQRSQSFSGGHALATLLTLADQTNATAQKRADTHDAG